jgi:hypothetical protein
MKNDSNSSSFEDRIKLETIHFLLGFPRACSGWVSAGICVCNTLRCGRGGCALGGGILV